jgi:hypothetical protein
MLTTTFAYHCYLSLLPTCTTYYLLVSPLLFTYLTNITSHFIRSYQYIDILGAVIYFLYEYRYLLLLLIFIDIIYPYLQVLGLIKLDR